MVPSQSQLAAVTLPSIHEMFPEHLLKNGNHEREPYYAQQGNEWTSAPASPNLPSPSNTYYSPSIRHLAHSRQSVAHSNQPASQIPNSEPHHSSASFFVNSSSHFSSAPSVGLHHSSTSGRRSDASRVSFDVLRSEPSNPTLQHLTSTDTLPNRGPSVPHNNAQSGMAIFRVSIPQGASSGSSSLSRSTSVSGQQGRYTSEASERSRDMDNSNRKHSRSDPSYPSIISFPVSGTSAASSSRPEALYVRDNSGTLSDDDGPEEANTGKKHICPTCSKRFNRPSSLRIHVNTHTGATPFSCPWPNCGREFNVNSNMRRHYRNHTTPGISRTQPPESRRRRQRAVGSSEHQPGVTENQINGRRSKGDPYLPSPPVSSFSVSDEEDSSFNGEYANRDEDDELHEYDRRLEGGTFRPSAQSHSMSRFAVAGHHSNQLSHHNHTLLGTRSLTPGGSGFQSSSPSASPSPPPSSRPAFLRSNSYNLSSSDSYISTSLRPAFQTNKVPSQNFSHDERMLDVW